VATLLWLKGAAAALRRAPRAVHLQRRPGRRADWAAGAARALRRRDVCGRYSPDAYPKFKKWCDE
jgi:hypothetical protein